MGWASGADLADQVWDVVKMFIPKTKQSAVAQQLIDVFEGRDCDTMMETSLWELANKYCPDCNAGGDFDWDNCYCSTL